MSMLALGVPSCHPSWSWGFSHASGCLQSVMSSTNVHSLYGMAAQIVSATRTVTEDAERQWQVMCSLVHNNPSPYGCWMLVKDQDFLLMSSSPEQLLTQNGERLSTRPIKGVPLLHGVGWS